MEDRIQNILKKADQAAGKTTNIPSNLTDIIRLRAQRKHTTNAVFVTLFVSVPLAILGTWFLADRPTQIAHQDVKIETIQHKVSQLEKSTETTLALIDKILDREERLRRIDELEAKVAKMDDSLNQVRLEFDKTAFILVNNANRMYDELDMKRPAIEEYKRIISLYPQSRWAEVAKQKLLEIKNEKNRKGDLL
ncbi:MAG: hypothetical protein JW804_04390 [Sedimentisphaerales bacterium]|nr:hypothetical protein [Sedimentisphaerales bacterium]